jgi:hypothetical protein
LLLGLIGFPVFAGFSGGLQHIYKPSFGFILGYIAAAYIAGKFKEEKNIKQYVWAAVISGTIIIYAFGLPYMYYVLNIMLNSQFTWIRNLSKGPWYSVAVSPGIHHTMGGIVINTNTEVISTDGKVIPGLFACGEVTGGVHGGNRVGGNAILDCLVFGKTAGEKSAAYIK